jgi:putative solute:sodium symporter small subunit
MPVLPSTAACGFSRPKRTGRAKCAPSLEEAAAPATRRSQRRAQSEGMTAMAVNNDVAWWKKTKNLMIISLVIWFFFGFVIHAFVKSLNEIVIAGFPLGFYMAAQGSLIVFVVLIFWFSARQDSIDREFGVAEDD